MDDFSQSVNHGFPLRTDRQTLDGTAGRADLIGPHLRASSRHVARRLLELDVRCRRRRLSTDTPRQTRRRGACQWVCHWIGGETVGTYRHRTDTLILLPLLKQTGEYSTAPAGMF